MKISVLAEPDSWHFLDLKRAAGDRHVIESRLFEKLEAEVGGVCQSNDDSGTPPPYSLESCDCILARAMPFGTLEQVVFRMDVLIELQRRGVTIVNPPRTIETSVDKYLALTFLEQSQVPVPRTLISQTVPQALEHYRAFGGDVVLKPLFGSMGRGLIRVQSISEAERHFSTQVEAGNVIYQQQFIDHGGFDLRLLVIGDQVLAMKRTNSNHWITNLAQGATGTPHLPTDQEKELAIRSARAVGAWIAGVDLLYEQSTGSPFVIEINSSPSWKGIGEVLQVDIAKQVLNFLEVRT